MLNNQLPFANKRNCKTSVQHIVTRTSIFFKQRCTNLAICCNPYSTTYFSIPACIMDTNHDSSSTSSNSSTTTTLQNANRNETRSVFLLTPNEMKMLGLKTGGYTVDRIRSVKNQSTNEERFKSLYGASPRVLAIIWEDLQTTQIPSAFVCPKDRKIKYFLMAIHHLKRYPTEIEREAKFNVNISWSRDWIWFYVQKIQALKAEKIVWPTNNFENDVFAISVDGTHCWINEPQHPTWSQDSKYFSHKHGKAGLNYELGISLAENKLVWMNGPFKAGMNDVMIFTQHGLKAKLHQCRKMAIGDAGYNGHPYHCSTPNNQDSANLKKFKSRALKRHETFNGIIKGFDCLSGRFRHSIDRFKNCFEAVCVIAQYHLEYDSPLFNVVIESIVEQK